MRYQEHNWVLTLHIDTKELTDTLGPHGSKVKRKKERLCVVLTTPYRAGEHTVCAPGLDSISGRVQAEAAIAGIQSLGVMKWIQAIDYEDIHPTWISLGSRHVWMLNQTNIWRGQCK